MDKKKIILNRAGELATESKMCRKMWLITFIAFTCLSGLSLLTGHCFTVKLFKNFFIDITFYFFITFYISIVFSVFLVLFLPIKEENRPDVIHSFIPKAIKDLSDDFEVRISESRKKTKISVEEKKKSKKRFIYLKKQLNDFEEEKKEFENLKKV